MKIPRESTSPVVLWRGFKVKGKFIHDIFTTSSHRDTYDDDFADFYALLKTDCLTWRARVKWLFYGITFLGLQATTFDRRSLWQFSNKHKIFHVQIFFLFFLRYARNWHVIEIVRSFYVNIKFELAEKRIRKLLLKILLRQISKNRIMRPVHSQII